MTPKPPTAATAATSLTRMHLLGQPVLVRGYQSAMGGLFRYQNFARMASGSGGEAYALVRLEDAQRVALDCRTCRHHTYHTGGCGSVLKCIEGSTYQRAGVRHCWADD